MGLQASSFKFLNQFLLPPSCQQNMLHCCFRKVEWLPQGFWLMAFYVNSGTCWYCVTIPVRGVEHRSVGSSCFYLLTRWTRFTNNISSDAMYLEHLLLFNDLRSCICSPIFIWYHNNLGRKVHSFLLFKTMHCLGEFNYALWSWFGWIWYRATFSHHRFVPQEHHDPWTMISTTTYHAAGCCCWARPCQTLCNQIHPNHPHSDGGLPLAVAEMIMHTIISLSPSLPLHFCLFTHWNISHITSIPAPLIVMSFHHLLHAQCAPFKPLQTPHMLLYFVSLVSTSFTCCVS